MLTLITNTGQLRKKQWLRFSEKFKDLLDHIKGADYVEATVRPPGPQSPACYVSATERAVRVGVFKRKAAVWCDGVATVLCIPSPPIPFPQKENKIIYFWGLTKSLFQLSVAIYLKTLFAAVSLTHTHKHTHKQHAF